ncbi:hypothetical protein G3O08_00705 [Cryomorpha ignava]|uniref:Uncharacterized protein n=1 Tax=Cryomorpha ignava TaxID=101383 RepID=A0A7K3WK48_9FLAO|nr:hypothetical protein [Cryomorpha ignava]NEN22023.1 hypothetical protein [Cryomorpha ignava]
MSKWKYKVQVLELEEIHEMPNGWTNEKYLELLKFLEADNPEEIPKDEIRDMAAMSLIDFEPEEAAEKVLEFRFGDAFNAGQRENIAVDARRLALWERYPDVKFHQEMFNVGYMLHLAFPMKFRQPGVARIKLEVKALNHDSAEALKNPDSGFIARMLAKGMDEHNTIYRLYQDSVEGEQFVDAEDIIWRFDSTNYDDKEQTNTLVVYTSWNWVDELKGVEEFESAAYNDEEPE